MSVPRLDEEFGLIRQLSSRCRTGSPDTGVVVGIGDDAAWIKPLPKGVLISKDLLIDGTHFRTEWSTPEQIIHKSFIANVSDINAMGGKPRWVLLGLGLPRSVPEDQKEELIGAVAKCCEKWGVDLIGGDTVESEQLTVSITIMGEPGERMLKRDGALPGQSLCISGPVGTSRAGLELLKEGKREGQWVDMHRYADCPAGLGEWLASHTSTTGCIDISDGLFSEAHHLASASRVRLVINENAIPVLPELKQWVERRGEEWLPFAGGSGEEFQLLFTCDEHSAPSEAIFPYIPPPWTVYQIGVVESGEGVVLQRQDGSRVPLDASGWRHFS